MSSTNLESFGLSSDDSPSWSEMKQLLTLAGQFHPATVLLFLAVQMDRLVVVTLWDNEALGKYVVAFSVASAGLSVVGASFHRVLLPHVARIADLHDWRNEFSIAAVRFDVEVTATIGQTAVAALVSLRHHSRHKGRRRRT